MFCLGFQREGSQKLGQTGSSFLNVAVLMQNSAPFCESKQGSSIQGCHGYCSMRTSSAYARKGCVQTEGWPIPCSSKLASASEALWWAGTVPTSRGCHSTCCPAPGNSLRSLTLWPVTDAAAAAVLRPAPPFNGREQSQGCLLSPHPHLSLPRLGPPRIAGWGLPSSIGLSSLLIPVLPLSSLFWALCFFLH